MHQLYQQKKVVGNSNYFPTSPRIYSQINVHQFFLYIDERSMNEYMVIYKGIGLYREKKVWVIYIYYFILCELHFFPPSLSFFLSLTLNKINKKENVENLILIYSCEIQQKHISGLNFLYFPLYVFLMKLKRERKKKRKCESHKK